MKVLSSSLANRCYAVWISVIVCGFPSQLLAHPGHYHPDETDEFDLLQATFFHSHGKLDYAIAVVFIASIAVAYLHGKKAVRLSAIIAALGSLCLLPIL